MPRWAPHAVESFGRFCTGARRCAGSCALLVATAEKDAAEDGS
jgi:hypothetical protein